MFINKRYFIYLISVVFFIVTMEISSRVDDKIKFNAPFGDEYTSDRLRTRSHEGLRINSPGSRFEKWKINKHGFRGPEISIEKSENIIRIVCMGTSETFGLYESPGKEWPAQLATVLNNDYHYEIINASVVGCGLKNYKQYIEQYVLKFNPDAILLYMAPYNNIMTHIREDKKKLQKRKEHKKIKKGHSFSLKNVVLNLRILPKIKQTLKQVIPSDVLKKYQVWNMTKQVNEFERRRLKGNKKPLDEIPQEALAAFQKELESLVDFIDNRNIEVILTSYPVLITRENIKKYPEIFLDARRFYVELSFNGMIDAPLRFNKTIKTVADKKQLAFVDNAISIPKEIKYFADNVHYTDEGAELVARNFVKFILEDWNKKMRDNDISYVQSQFN